jgi:hypothetical protein
LLTSDESTAIDTSMGDTSDASSDEKVARQREELNLTRRFVKAVERKLDQINVRGDSAEFKLEKEEMKAIMEINNSGLLEGAIAGIVSFLVLRRIRSGLLQRLQKQTSGSAGPRHAPKSPFQQKPITSTIDPSKGAMEQKIESLPENVLNRRSRGPSGAAYGIISWMVDLTVSFYVAVYVSVRNPNQLLHQVADLPLMEGRSKIVSELCPDFLAELREMQREGGDDREMNSLQNEALQNPQTPLLKAFLRFCHNCNQRAAYENMLRREQGLAPNDPVSIPPPGVPSNTIPNDMMGHPGSVWGEDSPALGDFDDSNCTDSNHTDQDDWTESFVTDQEDQTKREKENQKRNGRY